MLLMERLARRQTELVKFAQHDESPYGSPYYITVDITIIAMSRAYNVGRLARRPIWKYTMNYGTYQLLW